MALFAPDTFDRLGREELALGSDDSDDCNDDSNGNSDDDDCNDCNDCRDGGTVLMLPKMMAYLATITTKTLWLLITTMLSCE